MQNQIHTPSQLHTPSQHQNTNIHNDLQPPTQLEKNYNFEQKLGKGSQGQVWLATRKTDGEHVAIKQLHIHSVTTWKQYELFKREADILAHLNIEGVAPFYEYIEDLTDNPPFVCIVQKFVEGKTLAEMLKAKHRFKNEIIYDIIAQTLRILQNLHDHHPPIVHRDIKPSNLMLTPQENDHFKVTLLDFGAVANPQVQNGGSTVAGTFGYMPPEQLMGQAQPASDIYALAAVAVELLSGTSPADIPVCDFKLVIEPYLTHIPIQIVKTLNLMLEPTLSNRFCHHSQLIAQFDALANKKQPSILGFIRKTTVPKLRDVEHICQPGNYEIWQNLDQTKDVWLYKCQCTLNLDALEWIPPKFNISKRTRKKITFALSSTLLLLILMNILIGDVDIEERKRLHHLFISVVVPIYMGALFIKQVLKGPQTGPQMEPQIPPPKALKTIRKRCTDPEHLQSLIRRGKKIVGRITFVGYINAKSSYSCYAGNDSKGYLSFEKYINADLSNPILINYDIPTFIVVYQFKYPYAANQYIDCYATLLTHSQPEGNYKVGDPITLIANVSTTTYSTELSVIPFPYPYENILSINEIEYTCATNRPNLDPQETYLDCKDQFTLRCLSQIDACDKEAFINIIEHYLDYCCIKFEYRPILTYLIQKYQQKFGFTHEPKIYSSITDFDPQDAERNSIYFQVAQFYVDLYVHTQDKTFLDKANDIYRNKLDDENSRKTIYLQAAETCQALYQSTKDIDFLFKAANIYGDELKDEKNKKEVYQQVAKAYQDLYQSTNDQKFLYKAADIYRDKLGDKTSAFKLVGR